MDRFRWVVNDEWQHATSNTNIPFISQQFCDETLISRTHDLFIKTIFEFERLIEVLSNVVGFNVYFWTADHKISRLRPNETKFNKKYIPIMTSAIQKVSGIILREKEKKMEIHNVMLAIQETLSLK